MAKNAVRSEMSGFPGPSMKGATGVYDRMSAPFDKPRSTGGSRMPEKFMESMPAKTPTPGQTSGLETRAPRPGTTQRKYGTSNT